MSELIVYGQNKLRGEIQLQGSKNSALPILTASLICQGENIIHNCPDLSDVRATMKILKHLGCNVHKEDSTITVDSTTLTKEDIPDILMREIRSSIVFLGALISRTKKARLCFPGGCEIGLRPIDLHLKALREMGVQIEESQGFLDCSATKGVHGADITLSFPSVGATENIMLTAVLAKGTTTITNAAQEPEIVDLANYLNSCGAKIKGFGKSKISIEGVNKLHAAQHHVISDRIVAISYMCAVAGTQGNIEIKNVNCEHIAQVSQLFKEMGCDIKENKDSIYLSCSKKLKPLKLVRTMPYPGFPTDAQALMMALSCTADGTSIFIENIFENRFKHVSQLSRMGANIKLEGRMAVVEGVPELFATKLNASDLRAAAALTVASLLAKGKSEINNICYLDRGYENFEENLRKLGANIVRTE